MSRPLYLPPAPPSSLGLPPLLTLRLVAATGFHTVGTSAHAFTLLHDSERQAFEAQLASLGVGTTLLVDTYDVEKAVNLAVELAGQDLGAVRLDSGDLVAQAQKVREQLDALGNTGTKITVTSDLDEYAIASLAAAPVNAYGVGTKLVTGFRGSHLVHGLQGGLARELAGSHGACS